MSNANDVHYVSLGPTCSVAYQLQKMGLRSEALPFDWLRSHSVKDINTLIDTKFESFFDITFVKENTFPFIQDDFEEPRSVKVKVWRNKKLKIDFLHDFSETTTLEDVQAKYQRRIDRFFERLKNKCIFIRDDKYFKQAHVAEYNKLYDTLLRHNPESVLVLIVNIAKQDYDFSSLNSNIKLFKETKKFWHWHHDSIRDHISLVSCAANVGATAEAKLLTEPPTS